MTKMFHTGTFDLSTVNTTYLSPIPWVLVHRGNRVIVRKKQAKSRGIPQHSVMFQPITDSPESVAPIRVRATYLLLHHIATVQRQHPDRATPFHAALISFGRGDRRDIPSVVHVRPA